MERHNERKNEHYSNDDVVLSRADMNIHFKNPESGYLQTFDKMVADGEISTKYLQKDPNIINELVFDINTEYFEQMGEELGIGGYEYAKLFYEKAYQMAVAEAGGEHYILSAVMHADERNKAVSEKYGKDVYHYHLHVVFVPVVQKEVKWTKRCKDPALVGTVKEVITQVSSSKKWLSHYEERASGKKELVKSWSLLQDRFFNYMKDAGFTGFERGVKGSTAEHLDVLDFKIKQDTARAEMLATEVEQHQAVADNLTAVAESLTAVVEEKQQTATSLDATISGKQQTITKLDEEADKKKKQLESLEKKTAVKQVEAATFAEIDAMAKSSVISANLQISPADWKKVSGLAKEGIKAKSIITELKEKISKLLGEIGWFKKRLTRYEGEGMTDQMKYFEALQRAPQRLADTVDDIMRKPPEQQRQNDRITALKRDFNR